MSSSGSDLMGRLVDRRGERERDTGRGSRARDLSSVRLGDSSRSLFTLPSVTSPRAAFFARFAALRARRSSFVSSTSVLTFLLFFFAFAFLRSARMYAAMGSSSSSASEEELDPSEPVRI